MIKKIYKFLFLMLIFSLSFSISFATSVDDFASDMGLDGLGGEYKTSTVNLEKGLNLFSFNGFTSLANLSGCDIGRYKSGKYSGKKAIFGVRGRNFSINPNNAETKVFDSEMGVFLYVNGNCKLEYKYRSNTNNKYASSNNENTNSNKNNTSVTCNSSQVKIEGKCISKGTCNNEYMVQSARGVKLRSGYFCVKNSSVDQTLMKKTGNVFQCFAGNVENLKGTFYNIGQIFGKYKCSSNGFIKNDSNEGKSCSISNGTGKITNNKCVVQSCNSGYKKSANSCIKSNEGKICSITNGTGKIINGKCVVQKCDNLYSKIGNSCEKRCDSEYFFTVKLPSSYYCQKNGKIFTLMKKEGGNNGFGGSYPTRYCLYGDVKNIIGGGNKGYWIKYGETKNLPEMGWSWTPIDGKMLKLSCGSNGMSASKYAGCPSTKKILYKKGMPTIDDDGTTVKCVSKSEKGCYYGGKYWYKNQQIAYKGSIDTYNNKKNGNYSKRLYCESNYSYKLEYSVVINGKWTKYIYYGQDAYNRFNK